LKYSIELAKAGCDEAGFYCSEDCTIGIQIKKDGAMKKKTLISGFLIIVIIFLFSSVKGVFAQEAKEILSIEAYDMLNTVPNTYLIDVRTRSEYQFVGHPINAYLFPYMFMSKEFGKKDDKCGYRYDIKNKFFVEEIGKLFKKEDNLLIICSDGLRSEPAAKDLIDDGFKNVFNVRDGFEGPPFPSFKDSNRNKFYRQLAKRNNIYGYNHRRHYGWQWWGLPWTYHMDPKFVYPPDLRPSKKQ
jgi:rhodanese-related sulfurtransferase